MGSIRSRAIEFIINFFTTDLVRKAIALVIAVGLYVLISGNTGNEQMFSHVPLELEIPESLVNMDNSPPVLDRVIVRGSDAILKRISSGDLRTKAQVKLENYKSGSPYTLWISPDDVNAPIGVSVLSVEPQIINLNLEARTTKKVPVEAVFSGREEMNRDYAVSRVIFSPAEVTVSGTESLLRELKDVPTEPIPLRSGATESFDFRVGLSPRSGVTVSPSSVTAYVEVVKENETRAAEAVPIMLMMPPGMENKFDVELLSAVNVSVNLYGPRGKLALFQESELRVFADLSMLAAPGTYTVGVYCQEPAEPEISVKSVYPAQVQLKLTARKQ